MSNSCRPVQCNPNVAVFPNAISALPPLRLKQREKVLLFLGALIREHDWAPILPALNDVLRQQHYSHCEHQVRARDELTVVAMQHDFPRPMRGCVR